MEEKVIAISLMTVVLKFKNISPNMSKQCVSKFLTNIMNLHKLQYKYKILPNLTISKSRLYTPLYTKVEYFNDKKEFTLNEFSVMHKIQIFK